MKDQVGGGRNEADLVEAILITLNLMGKTFAWRMETSGSPRRNKDGSFRLTTNKGGTGKPDIAGVTYGYGFVMEVKIADKILPAYQRRWLLNYASRGSGHASVIHSVDEAKESIHEIWREKRIVEV